MSAVGIGNAVATFPEGSLAASATFCWPDLSRLDSMDDNKVGSLVRYVGRWPLPDMMHLPTKHIPSTVQTGGRTDPPTVT